MSEVISAQVIADLMFLLEVSQNNDDCPKRGNNSMVAFEVAE